MWHEPGVAARVPVGRGPERTGTIPDVEDRFEQGGGRTTPAHPNTPSGLAVFLAFAGVIVTGALGGIIGWGIADAACSGSCGFWLVLGALCGAIFAATGVGVVAVLLLRSVSEWRTHPPQE